MMNQHEKGRFGIRMLAGIGIAALSLIGTIAVGGAANAADPDAQVANIDADAHGTITVHKYQEIGSATLLDPAGPPPASGYTPLAGVQFTLYSVPGLSVTDPDDWPIFNTLTYDAAANTVSGTGFGPVTPAVVTSDTTQTDGSVVFGAIDASDPTSGLELGVYLVVEGDPGANTITKKTEPFFVTVPLPNDNEWLYSVHVYPKNSIASISKTVDTTDAYNVGDTITWPVTALIPQLPAGETYSSFSISDDFDVRLSNLAVDSVMIDGAAATYTTTGSSGQLLVVNPDLAAVNAAQGKNIVVTFSTTVASLGDDGIITNEAMLNLPGNVMVPSNEPLVRYGTLRIDKFANGAQGIDTTKPLNDASFAIYLTEAEATAALSGTVGTPVWTGTITTNGTITTTGLFVGDSVDEATTRDYYLIETKAPAGYTRTDTVIPVTIEASGSTAVSIVQIGNTQRPPVELPLTGSTGTAIFVAGGIGLILLAGGGALIASRRRSSETAEK